MNYACSVSQYSGGDVIHLGQQAASEDGESTDGAMSAQTKG